MKQSGIYITLLLLLVSGLNISQIRSGDLLQPNVNLHRYSATRFLPVYTFAGVDHWSSAKTEIIFDDVPFDVFAFNFRSIDLLPLDLIDAKASLNIDKNKIEINSFDHTSGNAFGLRVFMGGTTGDGLVHHFTRDEPIANKNKIIPSFAIKYQDNESAVKYGATAAYYGFFSTGEGNDEIIKPKDQYYFGKQNKQFLLNGNAGYYYNDDKDITLSTGLISYYGWDIAPALTRFHHLEMYNYRTKLSLNNLIPATRIDLLFDGSISEIHDTDKANGLKYELQQRIISATHSLSINKRQNIQLHTTIRYHKSDNINSSDGVFDSKLISKESTEYFYDAGIKYNYAVSNNIQFSLDAEYVNKFSKSEYEFNVCFDLLKEHSLIKLYTAKEVFFPTDLELYSDYRLPSENIVSSLFLEPVSIGNSNLKPAKSYTAGVKIYRVINKISASVDLRYVYSVDQVRQKNLFTYLAFETKELIRGISYENYSSFSYPVASLELDADVAKWLKLGSSIAYLDNASLPYLSKYRTVVTSRVKMPFDGNVDLRYSYNSRQFYKLVNSSQLLLPFNEHGFSGKINETHLLNIFYNVVLDDFYFIKKLELNVGFENIFNETLRYIPNGNVIGRTFLISLNMDF